MKLFSTACVYCLATVVLPQEAGAQNYTFTNMIDNTGPFTEFDSLALNNFGVVAFAANVLNNNAGVYRTDGVNVTTVADTTGPLELLSFIDMNDAGQVAFSALDPFVFNIWGIYRGDGNSVVTLADHTSWPFSEGTGQRIEIWQLPSINNSGAVAFSATGGIRGITAGSGIFSGTGGNLTTIAHAAGLDGPAYYFTSTAEINSVGNVAFVGQSVVPDPISVLHRAGIFVGNGGTTTTVIAPGGAYDIDTTRYFGFNDEGVVATAAIREEGTDVLRIDGASVEVIAGPYEDVHEVGLNNGGEVAFLAEFAPNTDGIFTGPDPLADRVIAEGDPLFGSTLLELKPSFFSNNKWMDGPNESGQIAFRYKLADGREGIALATPAVDPLCPGDYNGDGFVDAADYTVWRKNEGTTNMLPNDLIGDTIGAAQYNQWRTNFGRTTASGSGATSNAAIPEPAAAVLLMFVTAAWCLCRSRPDRKNRQLINA